MYDFLLVINTDVPPTLHRFRDIAFDRSNLLHLATPLAFNCPTEGFPRDDLREIFSECQWMTKVPNAVEILPKT